MHGQQPQASKSHTRAIAQFVSGLTYDAIPPPVRARLMLLILDAIGCGIYGAGQPWCTILQSTLGELDATRTTSVWGTGLRLSSPHATLFNGTQVQGFELDDVHRQGVLHVGAVVLPALIAVGESHARLSGRDFLTAAVAGYEIGPRVGMCMGQEHIGQGWHSGATVGVFAAAAGAARSWRRTDSPESSMCSKHPTGASVRRSRARPICSISPSSAPAWASASRPCASRSSSIPVLPAIIPAWTRSARSRRAGPSAWKSWRRSSSAARR